MCITGSNKRGDSRTGGPTGWTDLWSVRADLWGSPRDGNSFRYSLCRQPEREFYYFSWLVRTFFVYWSYFHDLIVCNNSDACLLSKTAFEISWWLRLDIFQSKLANTSNLYLALSLWILNNNKCLLTQMNIPFVYWPTNYKLCNCYRAVTVWFVTPSALPSSY